MEFADHGGKDVGGFEVEIVVDAVEIGGHDRDEAGPVLAVVGPAHLDPGDLGHGVGGIGGLQGTGQEVGLFHGLGAVPGVDAGASEKKKPPDPEAVARMDQVGLDGQVLVDEFRREGVIGVNPPHLGRRQEDVFRPLFPEKGLDGVLAREVKLFAGPPDDIAVSGRSKPAADGLSHQPPMARHIDFRRSVHACPLFLFEVMKGREALSLADAVLFGRLQILPDHDPHQFLKGDLRLPAQDASGPWRGRPGESRPRWAGNTGGRCGRRRARSPHPCRPHPRRTPSQAMAMPTSAKALSTNSRTEWASPVAMTKSSGASS